MKKQQVRAIWGVGIYYLVMAVALWALFRWVPGWADIFAGARLKELGATDEDIHTMMVDNPRRFLEGN